MAMSSSVPVAQDSGLEVDLRHEQMENEGLQKKQSDSEGLQHVSGPYVGKEPDGYSRRILGLSIGMFWLVVAVIVLVLAGGIGGGVAGGLAAQKNSCSQTQASSSTSPTLASATSSLSPSPTTSSSSSSSTTSSAATGIPSPQISTPCTGANPAANGSTLFAADATGSNSAIGPTPHTFLLLCNTNYPAGAAYGNPNLVDLLRLYTPDMAGCIAACAEYNIGYAVSSGGGPRCAAVAVVKAPGEFCYLKSATGVNNTSSSGGTPIDSAVLTS